MKVCFRVSICDDSANKKRKLYKKFPKLAFRIKLVIKFLSSNFERRSTFLIESSERGTILIKVGGNSFAFQNNLYSLTRL